MPQPAAQPAPAQAQRAPKPAVSKVVLMVEEFLKSQRKGKKPGRPPKKTAGTDSHASVSFYFYFQILSLKLAV